jgi:hypothetical protein
VIEVEMPEDRFDRIRKQYESKEGKEVNESKEGKEGNIKQRRRAYQMYLSKDAEKKLNQAYDEIRIAAIRSGREIRKNDFYSAVVAIGAQDFDTIKRYLGIS